MHLLCISGDSRFGKMVQKEAREQNWNLQMFTPQAESEALAKIEDVDVVLLDFEDRKIFEWWAGLSERTSSPVVVFNNGFNQDLLLEAFGVGANSYLAKDMLTPKIFTAQIASFSQKTAVFRDRFPISRLGIVIDAGKQALQVGNQTIPLTLTELRLIKELASENRVTPREEIQKRLFDGRTEVGSRALDVHVCTLRKKLKPHNLSIVSMRGVGYKLTPCRGE